MGVISVERLDHLGVVASVIKDLGIIEMIDARLPRHDQEAITAGEAVAGMILNGLGFSHRPLSLTPQFFVNKPLDMLFRPGVHADMFNRFKLGRSLDEVSTSGCDLLLSELALAVCVHERIDQRFHHLDTTSFSRSGEYAPESDEHAILLTHGYSKAHRPDLKQAVLELMVSQDGGVPLLSKSWDGNASDTTVFQERAQTLMTTLKNSPSPRYVVADGKLYHKDNAANLKALPFITRIPNTLKVVSHVMTPALATDTWHDVDEQRRYQCLELCHCGIAQRWLVVHAEAAAWRAESTIRTAQHKEYEAIEKHLFHLQARRFDTPASAHAALAPLAKTGQDHQVDSSALLEHKRYATKGRPRADTPCQAREWQIQARVKPDTKRIGDAKQVGAC